MNLDDIDRGLLELLLEDGRISFNDLGKHVGISTPTVSSRLRQLEERGIILGFHVRLDQDRLDQMSVLCTIEPVPGKEHDLLDDLVGHEMIREVYLLDGGMIRIKVTLPGGADIRVLLEVLSNRELIGSYTWNVIVKTHKELTRGYVTSGTGLNQPCMYCKGPIHGEPVRNRIGGTARYFCCPVCQREFRKKYDLLKERTDRS